MSFSNSLSLLKLMSVESVMPSNHFILCHPFLFLPSTFPIIRFFSNESVLCIRWPKYWSFSISPSNENSGLISFRINWFYPFAVQGTLKSLPQHYSSKVSILWCSAFFMVQLSHPYMNPGETIALTRLNFVGKVMSPLLNMLSRFVTAFLSRSKQLLTSWLHSFFLGRPPERRLKKCRPHPPLPLEPLLWNPSSNPLGLGNIVFKGRRPLCPHFPDKVIKPSCCQNLGSLCINNVCQTVIWRQSYGGKGKSGFITLPGKGGKQ